MLFSKAYISYFNTLYILYMWLRVRDVVSNVWHGIRNTLKKLPVEYRSQLLNEVNE